MRADQPLTIPPRWELMCWRIAAARDRAVQRLARVAGRLPGAGLLRRMARRAARIAWWTITLQLPRHIAWWLHARRTRPRPIWTTAALITDAVSPVALRLPTSANPVVSVVITS